MNRRAISLFERVLLRIIAYVIADYADYMVVDVYGDTREYERDSHLQSHLRGLADHIKEILSENTVPTDVDISGS